MEFRSSIRFWHRGSIVTLERVDPTRTLLDWLREDQGLTGTKEGCNEGDCGACTVLMATLVNGEIDLRPVNACIVFLPMLDGRAIFTVEDLKGRESDLHPVQEAMVKTHGSQCGFCTPGIVMTLAGLYHSTRTPSRQQVLDQLAGNLCRCTGYGPIIEAAMMMGTGDDPVDVLPTLLKSDLAGLIDQACIKGDSVDGTWFVPATRDQLALILNDHPDTTMVAGATDVGLWANKGLRRFSGLVFLHRIAELAAIRETGDGLEIGAMATYQSARPVLSRYAPAFDELLRRLGSEQVRAMGTIGGNIANGSPIGDMPPLLIAAGACLRLRSLKTVRELALEEFFLSYGTQDLRQGEYVDAVILPRQGEGWRFQAYKLSKRFDQDISAICGAFSFTIDNGRIGNARMAFGGMAGVPARARKTEASLIGANWDEFSIQQAMSILETEFDPLSDQRGSESYRRIAARNLLWRAWLDSADDGPVRSLAKPNEEMHAHA